MRFLILLLLALSCSNNKTSTDVVDDSHDSHDPIISNSEAGSGSVKYFDQVDVYEENKKKLKRAISLKLFPNGNGSLPADAEKRALLYLKPHPSGFVGHLPEPFNFEDFTYNYHKCHDHKEGLVCTACYKHPKKYLGTLSVVCPYIEGQFCTLLLFGEAFHYEDWGVDPAWCEIENRRRIENGTY